jgi:hypothetical protein
MVKVFGVDVVMRKEWTMVRRQGVDMLTLRGIGARHVDTYELHRGTHSPSTAFLEKSVESDVSNFDTLDRFVRKRWLGQIRG